MLPATNVCAKFNNNPANVGLETKKSRCHCVHDLFSENQENLFIAKKSITDFWGYFSLCTRSASVNRLNLNQPYHSSISKNRGAC